MPRTHTSLSIRIPIHCHKIFRAIARWIPDMTLTRLGSDAVIKEIMKYELAYGDFLERTEAIPYEELNKERGFISVEYDGDRTLYMVEDDMIDRFRQVFFDEQNEEEDLEAAFDRFMDTLKPRKENTMEHEHGDLDTQEDELDDPGEQEEGALAQILGALNRLEARITTLEENPVSLLPRRPKETKEAPPRPGHVNGFPVDTSEKAPTEFCTITARVGVSDMLDFNILQAYLDEGDFPRTLYQGEMGRLFIKSGIEQFKKQLEEEDWPPVQWPDEETRARMEGQMLAELEASYKKSMENKRRKKKKEAGA